jgi:hypothetical protein
MPIRRYVTCLNDPICYLWSTAVALYTFIFSAVQYNIYWVLPLRPAPIPRDSSGPPGVSWIPLVPSGPFGVSLDPPACPPVPLVSRGSYSSVVLV